jgi:hypothetical protein
MLALSVALAIGSTGCINDNPEEDCGETLSVAMSYTNHTGSGDRFAQEVAKVDVFVFDKDGKLAARQTDVAVGTMTAQTVVLEQLPEGEYSVVVWGNTDQRTAYEGMDNLADFSLKVAAAVSGTPFGVPALFHGSATVDVTTDGENTVSVPLTKDRKHVVITLVDNYAGGGTRATVPYDFELTVEGKNGVYKADNNLSTRSGELLVKYEVGHQQDDGRHIYQFDVLRMFADGTGDLRFDFSDAGLPVHNRLLAAEILGKVPGVSTQADLDRQDRYELTYEVQLTDNGAYGLVLISINGWDVIDSGGDL